MSEMLACEGGERVFRFEAVLWWVPRGRGGMGIVCWGFFFVIFFFFFLVFGLGDGVGCG